MKKADYSKIASTYDKARPLSHANVDLWLGLVRKHGSGAGDARLLDLGCGTGRFAIPLAIESHYRVTGADASPEMLAKAREKDKAGRVRWETQDAVKLTYCDQSFDILFLSHLLHHVDSPAAVIRECWRVLAVPGSILIRYGAIEQIRDDPPHRFFPDALAIDEPRTPSVEAIESWLIEAGFDGVFSTEVIQRTYEAPADLLDAVMHKSSSFFSLISDRAYEDGLRELTAYIANHPDDPWLLHDKLTLTVGHKQV